jgi:predicted ATPase
MEGQTFLKTLHVQNLLSYGSAGITIDLAPLNVLIGPNASGKSNIIESISLLQAMPGNFAAPIRASGGIDNWLWKGNNGANVPPSATLEVIASFPIGMMPLRYRMMFTMVNQRLEIVDEAIENEAPVGNNPDTYFFYRYQQGFPVLNVRTTLEDEAGSDRGRTRRSLKREDIKPDQSVLSQRKDPDLYPELTYLGNQFAAIRFYREWNLGRGTEPRKPQKPDGPDDFLEEDAHNLGLVLNNLQHTSGTKQQIITYLQMFYPLAEDITTRIHGGTVQLFVHERGLRQPVPATRLSDGTLRYLCLLAVLCHPAPPPLICLEEPELGLHPDILPTIAELLTVASQRTQLIVTTHSDVLVSALSDIPQTILVCERDDQGSMLHRLDQQQLQEWLEDYTLGELWRMGEIGGNRW